MIKLPLTTLVLLASTVVAKQCMNATVPVTISARTAVFDLPIPHSNSDATAFIQNFTQAGRNFTDVALSGYETISGIYNISTQFCKPDLDNSADPTVQVLTHGIGFDKTYWDTSYNDFNYSYIDVATDSYKYCTLSYDRLGIGNSSHGEPINEIQTNLEVAALAELTLMLRNGTFPGVNHAFNTVTHVGHSYGSAQTAVLVNMYPDISDGIVLTGYSANSTFTPYFLSGGNFILANLNQPFRFGNASFDLSDQVIAMLANYNISVTSTEATDLINNYGLTDYVAGVPMKQIVEYVDGYLANSNAFSNQFLFLHPGNFDPAIGFVGEETKQPVTLGELLTLGSVPMANVFTGPVLVLTGEYDLPYCGGDCFATGDPRISSIPAEVQATFPYVSTLNFTAYIQPNTGHGLNFHYNQTGTYNVMNEFLNSKGLATS